MEKKAKLLCTTGIFALLAFTSITWTGQSSYAQSQNLVKEIKMEIRRNGSQPSAPGPADYFTGNVRIDALFKVAEPSRLNGATVTFEPGARTAWHTHPLGQTVIVTAGKGWAQIEGGKVQEINPGDIVSFPANTRHWHGATRSTGMTHIALQEALDGKVVEWMEKVTDAQYTDKK